MEISWGWLGRIPRDLLFRMQNAEEKCQSTCSGVCKWFVGECAAKTKFENLNHNIGRKELQKPRHVFHWKRTRRESTQDYKLLNHCVARTCIEYFFSRVTCVAWKLGLNSSPKLEVVCKKHKQGNPATKSSIYTRIYFSYTLVSPRRGQERVDCSKIAIKQDYKTPKNKSVTIGADQEDSANLRWSPSQFRQP